MASINEEAAELRKLKQQRDAAKNEFESLNARFKSAQLELMDRMESEKVEGLKVDGTNFVPTITYYGQVQDRNKFVEWALENEPELVEHKERGERINELARRLLDDGEPFPPGLGFREQKYISQRVA